MYVAKDLHKTKAYQQLRLAVDVLVQDERARPSALGRLVRMVLNNINTNNKESANKAFRLFKVVEIDIDNLMIWRDTNEGHEYWEKIHIGKFVRDFNLFPKVKAKPIHEFDFAQLPEPPQIAQHDIRDPIPPKAPPVKAKKPELEEQPKKKRMMWWGAV